MNVQFAIQTRHGLRAGSESARLAHRARTSPRRPACRSPRSPRAAWRARRSSEQGVTTRSCRRYFSVKEAVFPFVKFPGVDTILGPEMKSTGEVMGVGETFAEAFVKSQLAAGVKLPEGGKAFISVRDGDKVARGRDRARSGRARLHAAWRRAARRRCSRSPASRCTPVNKVAEGRPHIVDMIKNGEVELHRQHGRGNAHRGRSGLARRSAPPRSRTASPTTRPIAGAKAACAGMKHTRAARALPPAGPACATRSTRWLPDMNKIPMTWRGAELLRAELHQLKTVERPASIPGDRRGARARRPLGERRVPRGARARRASSRAASPSSRPSSPTRR